MKILIASVIFLSQFIATSSQAQQLTDVWRLEKTTWVLPNGESSVSEYRYDAQGRMNRIRHYENKKLQSTQAAFMYDQAGLIVNYIEFYPLGADRMQYYFTYDNQHRLVGIDEIKHKYTGATQTMLTRSFSYNSNEIKESKIQPSFGGTLSKEITYSLNQKGNIVRSSSKENGKNTADYIYGEYDENLHPLAFTAAYFNTQFLPRHYNKEGYWEGDKPAKTTCIYNTDGMLQNASVTYTLDNRPYTHKYNYSYSKIRSASKPVIK